MDAMYELESMQPLETGSSDKDHNLSSLDFSKCSTSSPSFFDQGGDASSTGKPTLSGIKYSSYPSVSSPSTSIFEFPSLDELDNMGCDLLNGFWDEDQVQDTLNSSGCGAGALNFTFGDTGDFSSRLSDLKPTAAFSSAAPTLTELNMEDSMDSLFSLKPKASISSIKKVTKPATLSMPVTPDNQWKVVRDEHSGLSISPTTWNNVKNSRELSNTGLFVPKIKTEVVEESSDRERPMLSERQAYPSQRTEVKIEPPRVDFANLFGRRSRKTNGAKPGRKPLPLTISAFRMRGEHRKMSSSPTSRSKEEKSNKRVIIHSSDGFPNKHFHKEVEDDDDDVDDDDDDEGVESHDEGLGSENEEEHHDYNEDDEDDLADDASDISEEIAPLSLSLDPSNQAGGSQVRSRRSEYDDFTPNPEKLLFIGRELQKLNNIIHDMKPTGDPSSSSRNKTRREKNKLASRACRLKKKAQHEANKLKIKALKDEHACLSEAVEQVKQALKSYHENPGFVDASHLSSRLEQMINRALEKSPVAGQTDSFVNLILDRTAHGEPTGLKLVLDIKKEESLTQTVAFTDI